MDNFSRNLKLSGQRVYDALFCTNPGVMTVRGQIRHPETNDWVRSDPLEIICLDVDRYEMACEEVAPMIEMDMGIEDAGFDEGLDMDFALEDDLSIFKSYAGHNLTFLLPMLVLST